LRTELSLSDEWETPDELYQHLCEKYNIHPEYDVAAIDGNSKCMYLIDKEQDSFVKEWGIQSDIQFPNKADVWCNPPHSKNEEFVKRAYDQWVKHNINIMMILPANALCTNYAENWIEPFAEYHPINRSLCKFLYHGKTKDSSRNGYFVVIWRKI